MSIKESKEERRAWVVINYASLALVLVFLFFGQKNGWSLAFIILLGLSVAAALLSFIVLHVSTGLWKYVHTRVENLDERQVIVTHESLRYSYSIFSILILGLMLLKGISGYNNDILEMPLFASLLYLAHTLPASVIAWREKEI
jgi:hypothetical protein